MGWFNLLVKDLREHGIALFSLLMGFVLVVLVALEQQRSGAFDMSRFEVVRFSLITVLPLIAFIVGNRLIVREYVGGTRLFVEALPIRITTPLVVKFLFGLFYMCSLSAMVVLLAAGSASAAEAVDQQYFLLLLSKTLCIAALFWCLVFFISFTGRLRLFIYVVLAIAVMFAINMPGIDETRLAPFALMDRQLFVFEREVVPYRQFIETGVIALLFVLGGFALAFVNEGSIAEQLGKPISRRDMAAFALIGLGCLTVYSTLQKKWDVERYEFSGDYVVRNENPKIAVSYIEEKNKELAEKILNDNVEIISQFKADIGLDRLPQVQIALNTELEHTEIEPELLDGVLLTANYIEYGDFEHGLLNAIAMHHLLLSLSNGRWDFETRHWLLDGLARWWAEGGTAGAPDSINNPELFALATVALQRSGFERNPLPLWQTITDRYGFEAADAMSYTAILYLQEIAGGDVVIELAADYVNEMVGESSVESVKRLFNKDNVRFERITGYNIEDFFKSWSAWLQKEAQSAEIAELVNSVPVIMGDVQVVRDPDGSYSIHARYEGPDDYTVNPSDRCVLRHQIASAFDLETMIYERERDRQPCQTGEIVHKVGSPYAPGDRVYAVLEFEGERFHRPIPIWTGRLLVR